MLGAGALLAVLAFAGGTVAGALHVSSTQQAVERFAKAWARGDYPAMYSELSPPERSRVRRTAFSRAYQKALDTATAVSVVTVRAHDANRRLRVRSAT